MPPATPPPLAPLFLALALGTLAPGLPACQTAPALEAPNPAEPEATVLVPASALVPVFPQSEALATALATRDHASAVLELQKINPKDLKGSSAADYAFVLAWSKLRAGKALDAAPQLEALRHSETAPEAYRRLVEGEILEARGEHVEAAATLTAIPREARIWPRAALAAAEAYQKAERTSDARKLWTELADRPDPSEGSERALAALAARAGDGSDEAYALLRRIWTAYPTTKAGKDAATALASYEVKGSKYLPTRSEIAGRADALQRAERWEDTISLVGAKIANFEKIDASSCRARYAYGRALFKKNKLTEAVNTLTAVGNGCVGKDDDAGAQALYIIGKATERRKMWAEAASAYQKIPALYPTHSMADDGYALAGIAWQETGDTAKAVKLWEEQVLRYADGDLAAEGFWRLGWTRYLAGDPVGAIGWTEKMLWEVPLDHDPVHVLAARYWSARWRLYPDVNAPTRLTESAEQRAQGLRLLAELCREHPSTYYGQLAANRLYELAPRDLNAVPRPDWKGKDDSLHVRAELYAEPAVRDGLALTRLGLIGEAMAELGTLDEDTLSPSELALITRVQARVDPVVAHNRLHHFLLKSPTSTLGADADAVLRQAYPDLYWQELKDAASAYAWDPRIFHGLVREESSFNPKIVSWAGARGLSQLMPATAREVAKQMGITVNNDQLFDPKTNLKIGTRFFDGLMKKYRGSAYLAAASYNAGPGNVDGWLSRFGNVPTDEYVERIPIRETRHYVKRVLGTYQVYHALYDPDPLFADWSRTNHKAKPDSAD